MTRSDRPILTPRIGLFLVSAAVAGILLVNFCDWVYQCGCRSLWNGADAHCNVHDPDSPNCPWCEHRPAGDIIPLAAILSVQLGVCFTRRPLGNVSRLVLSLVAFPVVGGLVALVFGLATGYWSS